MPLSPLVPPNTHIQTTPSWPGLPLSGPKMRSCPLRLCLRPPAGGWGKASCFPWIASCFAHQEAVLAPLLKPLLWLGCSVAAGLSQGLGAVNSSGPRQPPPCTPAAHPFCLPLSPAGVPPHKTSRDPKKTKHCYSHPHGQLLPLSPPHNRALSSGDPR